MLLGLVLIALVVIIVLLVILLRQRRAAAGTPTPPPAADPLRDVNDAGDVRTARVGDMIDYLGVNYFVRGTLRLREGGFAWAEHFLDDGRGTKRWISVEEDPDLEVVLWTERPLADLAPAEKTLTVDGVEYRRSEHGTANFVGEGTTGLGAEGTVEYVDYEGPDGHYLGFERFGGGGWEVGVGEQVLISALTLYPSGPRP